MTQEALKLALEALEFFKDTAICQADTDIATEAITAIKEALAQSTWVGLTDEDEIDWEEDGSLRDLVKAIEAKLKEKNT